MASITPSLHGDIKAGQNSFLTVPVSAEDLHISRAGRDFWFYIDGTGPWSAAGHFPRQEVDTLDDCGEEVKLTAGFLWHKVLRENRRIGIRVEITNFVPLMTIVELMIKSQFTLEKIHITPGSCFPAVPPTTCGIIDVAFSFT